ncbi:hypothetical protein ACFFLM_11960 [Deinococcus oregonensis]|uniref:N-acetyltransferase domain-containing protein n=1 Tax=Deinococcus oregonensis TaxID=1805970 RepID=A0ABV6AYU8_9DEIO
MEEGSGLQVIEDEQLAEQLYRSWGESPTEGLYVQEQHSFYWRQPPDCPSVISRENGEDVGLVFWGEDDGDGGFWFVINPVLEPIATGRRIVEEFLNSARIMIDPGILLHQEDKMRREIVEAAGMVVRTALYRGSESSLFCWPFSFDGGEQDES